MNTFLAGASGALTAFFLNHIVSKSYSLVAMCNGMLCGLVCVTGASDCLYPWAAALFGLFGGATYHFVAAALVKLHIDDPIDAIPVHFGGGLVGTFMTGLFSKDAGLFYGKGGRLLGN